MKVSTQQNLDTATCPIKCLKKLLLWTHHVFTSVSYSRNTKFSQATVIVTPESSEKQLPLILIFQAFDFTPTTMSSARSMRSRSKVSFLDLFTFKKGSYFDTICQIYRYFTFLINYV